MLPGWLGQLFSRILSPAFRLSRSKRVRLLILNSDDKVLLVRNNLGRQNWSLPGGGVRKQESLQRAASREVYEETGIQVDLASISRIGTYICYESHSPFEVEVLYTSVEASEEIARLSIEIVEAKWTPLMEIENCALPVHNIIKEIRHAVT